MVITYMPLLEKAAKAMFSRHSEKTSTKLKWDELTDKAKAGYIEDARVAFKVLRDE